MGPGDDELAARAAGPDGIQAFAALVRRHQSDIRCTLRRFTRGDHALADDLAQETFIRAWTGIASFRRESSFRTWLFRIAYRCFLSHARRPAAETALLDDTIAVAPDTILSGDFMADFDAAMERLGPVPREVVHLALQRGFSHPEIAAIMELPIGTVKSHVLRGRQTLQTLLSDWQEG